jgi:hypothetical protein
VSKSKTINSWSRCDDPGPNAATRRPPDSRSIAASVFASATGPRSVLRATVVASVSRPERSMTLASAVSPSSHGRWKTKWSLADIAAKPHSLAASAAAPSRACDNVSSSNWISGR